VKWRGPALMLVTEPSHRLEEIVDAAVSGGVNIVQLRDKSAAPGDLSNMAKRLAQITKGRALLVVNGDAQIAPDIGFNGVHLPEQGRPVTLAREMLGKGALIGRSVHSIEAARSAEQDGVDYVVAGTIFVSKSHPTEPPAGLGFLRAVCSAVTIPVIAIGGVTPENAGDCIRAGAAGIAVLSPIMQASDPYAVAVDYRRALDRPEHERRTMRPAL